MNTNLKQTLSSTLLVVIAIFSFILLAPFFIFLVIFIIIFSFLIRQKIIKENSEFFKNTKTKKGRVIDQKDIDQSGSNPSSNN